MLGVVVWSNEPRNKAVIWCEDQGALAYLEGLANLSLGSDWPNPGDLVELECRLEGGLRLAHDVRLVSQGVGSALPQALRASVAQADAASAGQVVPSSDQMHLRLVSTREPIACPANSVTAMRSAVAGS